MHDRRSAREAERPGASDSDAPQQASYDRLEMSTHEIETSESTVPRDRDFVDAGGAPSGHQRPARVTLASAMRRYPVVVLLPIVALVAAGIAIGQGRKPTYTASTQLQVGSFDIASQATPGYVQAEVTLATAYSREVESQLVYRPAARRLRLSPQSVAARLSSSAVPSNPNFTINATGPSPRDAIRLAGAATDALHNAVNVVNQGEMASTQLLNRYRNAQREANRLAVRSATLQRAAGTTTTTATAPTTTGGATAATSTPLTTSPAIQRAQLDQQVAQLQAQTLANLYTQASNTPRSGAIIQVLIPASSASSDRRSITERYGVIGALAGAIVGAMLALLVAKLRSRRGRRTTA